MIARVYHELVKTNRLWAKRKVSEQNS
jgi:hypothetical protein